MVLATRVWSGLDSVRTPIQPKVFVGESPKSHIAKTASRKGLLEFFPRIAFRAPQPLDKYLRLQLLFVITIKSLPLARGAYGVPRVPAEAHSSVDTQH